jgi:hypothetical protein
VTYRAYRAYRALFSRNFAGHLGELVRIVRLVRTKLQRTTFRVEPAKRTWQEDASLRVYLDQSRRACPELVEQGRLNLAQHGVLGIRSEQDQSRRDD